MRGKEQATNGSKFGGDENALKLMVAMVIQLWEYFKDHGIRVNCVNYILLNLLKQ